MQRWERQALSNEAHEELRLEKVTGEELLALGYHRSLGTPKGQKADYRKALDDGRGLHVRVYSDRATVHWDRTAPSVSPVGHLIDDARGEALTGGATILALLALPFL